MTEMDEVDSLFDQLKKFSQPSEVACGNNENELQKNQDLVKLDDENGHADAELKCIEKNLKQLPKLHSRFDSLIKNGRDPYVGKSYAVIEDKNRRKRLHQQEWFTLPAPSGEFAHRIQKDLQLIKHRAALDPKRHYKKEKWKPPERFAVGTIIQDSSEYFSARLPRKQRGETILSTLLKDVDSKKYLKRKYNEIQSEKNRRGVKKKSKRV